MLRFGIFGVYIYERIFKNKVQGGKLMKNFIHHSAIRHSFPLLIRSIRAEDII